MYLGLQSFVIREITLIFSLLQRAVSHQLNRQQFEGNLINTELGCFFTVSESSGIFSRPMFGYSWQWLWFWWSSSGGHGCFEVGETGKFDRHRSFRVLLAISSPVTGFLFMVVFFFNLCFWSVIFYLILEYSQVSNHES